MIGRRLVACAVWTVGLVSCSLVHDLSGFEGTRPDGGSTPTPKSDEDCTNGIDDNQDGLADCADPMCTQVGYSCRPIPEGWRGPFVVSAGTNPLPCAAPFGTPDVEGHDELQTTSSCNCSCGGLTGESCTAVLYAGSSCGSATPRNIALACTDITDIAGAASVVSPGVTEVRGTCAPSGDLPPDVTWKSIVRSCGSSAAVQTAGCTGEARCVPPTPSGFASGQCISRDGDLECPVDYPTKRISYLGASCGCTCEAPACATAVGVYTGAGCTENGYVAGPTCTGLSALKSARIGSGGPRLCTPKTGSPTGKATPSSPTTFCCTGSR